MAKIIEEENINENEKENVIINENSDEVTATDKMSLRERILHVINEIRITKTGKNTFSQYDYFKPEEINQRVNPLLLKYKIFPLFYTCFEGFETEVVETSSDKDGMKYTTKRELKEIAKLEFQDILGRDQTVIYQMPIERIEIKGANKMQNLGGVRTYAKRYLYMEALNISDDKLDLDSDNMANKVKGKQPSTDTRVAEVIGKIQVKVEALRSAKVKDTDIAKIIKSVYSDGGKPSANYKNCQTVEEAEKILEELNKTF